jgi:hypothetical protein
MNAPDPYANYRPLFTSRENAKAALTKIAAEATMLKGQKGQNGQKVYAEFVADDIDRLKDELMGAFSNGNWYSSLNYLMLREMFIVPARHGGPPFQPGGRRRKLSRRVTYRRKSKKRSHRRSRK